MNRRRVKIICTIGPATESPDVLEQLILQGMNAARLNMSHGFHDWHARTIKTIRTIADQKGVPLAILVDLQGPRIRVGTLPGESIQLQTDQPVYVIEGSQKEKESGHPPSDPQQIPIGYPSLMKDIRSGARILMDDGLIELIVENVEDRGFLCRVKTGGWLKSRKGVNFPDSQLSTPSFTEKDQHDLQFALKHDVDYVALSFVRSPDDVNHLKEQIKLLGKDVPVIAKIERPEAVEQLDQILQAADGVMVARGDLAIEMSPEDIPVLQKRIISSANNHRRLVITATQMLESMTKSPIPTRAEATDVANAVFDGTDAVMLSAETSAGNYPIESVRVMNRIVRRAEDEGISRIECGSVQIGKEATVPEAVCAAAAAAAKTINAKAIVALTESGSTARLISYHRPAVPIVALTPSKQVQCQMSLYWCVLSYVMKPIGDTDHRIQEAEKLIKQEGLAKPGDRLVILTGVQAHQPGGTNLMKIHGVE